MPRLIALVLLVVAVLGLAAVAKRAKRSAEQRKNTYRPEATKPKNPAKPPNFSNNDETVVAMMTRKDAQQLRDALTGASIDTQKRVWQCDHCQSVYHQDSITALEKEHHGQCIQCQSTVRQLVVFTD